MHKALPAFVVLAMLSLSFPIGATGDPGICRTINPEDSSAMGEAVVLQILQGPDAPYTLSEVQARQNGPGMAHDYNESAHVRVSAGGDLVRLVLAPTRTDVRVDADPLAAGSWTTAELLQLDILDGLVTADAVKAATYATADVRHAQTDSGSSEIVGLRVKGVSITQVAPGARIDLPVAFGTGSYLSLYERTEASSFPSHASILYDANVTVRMLHIYLADYDLLAIGAQPLEVVVGMSHSRAIAPTPHCSVHQFVGAGAYIARIRAEGGLASGVLVGEQHIGPVDGDARQQLFGQEVAVAGEVVTANATETTATGRVSAGVDSRANAMAQVSGVCLVVNGTDACLVSATLIKAESSSFADVTTAVSTGHTTLVGLTVAGVDVCGALGLASICSPPMNTKLDINGIQVILNQRQYDSPQPGHTGYAVRAVRIIAPGVGDVVIARAYSEAAFTDLDA